MARSLPLGNVEIVAPAPDVRIKSVTTRRRQRVRIDRELALLLVCQLTSKDLPLADALLTTFGEAFDDVESYSTRRPSAEYLRRSLAGETLIVVAALIDSTVVGGLSIYRSTERDLVGAVPLGGDL